MPARCQNCGFTERDDVLVVIEWDGDLALVCRACEPLLLELRDLFYLRPLFEAIIFSTKPLDAA